MAEDEAEGTRGKMFYLRLSAHWEKQLPILAGRLSELLGIEVSNAKAMQMALRRLDFWVKVLDRMDEVDQEHLRAVLASLGDESGDDEGAPAQEPEVKPKGKGKKK